MASPAEKSASTQQKQSSSKFDDCFDPACHDKLDMLKKFGSFKPKTGPTKSKLDSKAGNAASPSSDSSVKAVTSSLPTSQKTNEAKLECPATREEIGRSGWSLLHTMGAYYPEKPSKEEQELANTFVKGFARFYPCSYCAKDFQEEIKKSPPRTSSNVDFSVWLCEQHNIVNKKLGKETFPCKWEGLVKRWRKGAPECWANPSTDSTAEESLGRDADEDDKE